MKTERTMIDALNIAVSRMEDAGNVDAKIDAWLLAEFVFGITREKYYQNPSIQISEKEEKRFFDLVNKRCSKVPLQHITEEQEFMGFVFKVNKEVLIPRQETEILVEKVVDIINEYKNKKVKVLDMCTGSGCIAISVVKLCSNAKVTAVDISEKALELAKKNAGLLGADIKFIQSDLFENVKETYDIIISNPPYIPTDEINKLMEEVRQHEPLMALDGDLDGLKFYNKISKNLVQYLEKNGMVIYEIGYDQGITVPNILKENNFKDINVYKDMSGNDRVVTARKEDKNV